MKNVCYVRFREERFIKELSDTVAGYSELVKITGLGRMYQYISNKTSSWNNDFVEPMRDLLLYIITEDLRAREILAISL
ncbi:MAG: hypothetical protein WBP64_01730 [Nitrososphaeraceae archaeon]